MLGDLVAALPVYLAINWVSTLVFSMEESTDHATDNPTTGCVDNDHPSPAAPLLQHTSSDLQPLTSSPHTISDHHSLTAPCRNSNCSHSDVWKRLGCPRFILAPMVDASELPWRLLSRRYGAQLCYTPMVAAHQFVTDKKLRAEILQSTPEDRPLIVQFCGNDAKNLSEAARVAEPHCDGIDINIGCPQMVAKKGRYGAYLQDEWPLLTEIVSTMRSLVKVPISCKIRIYESVEKTVEYARMLEKAGCQFLAVHGRTVEQRGINTGLASWEHITAVVKAVGIPVIANGNIQCWADVHKCMTETGVAAVMTAEGNLHNPALFADQTRPAWELAAEYLDLVKMYPVRLLYARGHIFNMCHHLLVMPENHDVRYVVGKTNTFEDLRKAVDMLRERFVQFHDGRAVWNCSSDNNMKLPPWICQPYVRPTSEERELKLQAKPEEEKLRGYSVSRLKKLRKLKAKEMGHKRKKPDLCAYTKRKCGNPRSQLCGYALCRKCCKEYCVAERKDCEPHRHFSSKELRIKFETKRASPSANGTLVANGLTDNVDCKRVKLEVKGTENAENTQVNDR